MQKWPSVGNCASSGNVCVSRASSGVSMSVTVMSDRADVVATTPVVEILKNRYISTKYCVMLSVFDCVRAVVCLCEAAWARVVIL